MGGISSGEGFYVPDPCELTFANTLLLSNAAVSLGGGFVSLEISCSLLIFFSLFSFILVCKSKNLGSWVYRLMIQFMVLSSFFLQDYISFILWLVFFLLSLFFWGCSFSFKNRFFSSSRISELHLFYNLQIFYWHFIEVLWLFIFLVL